MSNSLFGTPPKLTYRYARIVWNGYTFDFADPIVAAQYELTPVAGTSITASGKREVTWERHERVYTIVTSPMDQTQAEQVDRFIEDWGGQGEQFEFYLDRYLRSFWGFEGHPKDNNRDAANAFRIASKDQPDGNDTGDVIAYVAFADGFGATVPTGNRALRASLVAGLSGSNAFLSTSTTEGGTLGMVMKPTYTFGDAAEHYLLDLAIPGAYAANRIRLVKCADNVLRFVYAGSNGGATVIEASGSLWAANAEVPIILQWGALADLQMKVAGTVYSTKKYTITASGSKFAGTGLISGQTQTSANGGETTFDVAPSRITLGRDELVLGGGLGGSVGFLAIYRALFPGGPPTEVATWRHPARSYFPRGELSDTTFRPVRLTPAKEYVSYQMRIRDGH